jgi:hypothetical protein
LQREADEKRAEASQGISKPKPLCKLNLYASYSSYTKLTPCVWQLN